MTTDWPAASAGDFPNRAVGGAVAGATGFDDQPALLLGKAGRQSQAKPKGMVIGARQLTFQGAVPIARIDIEGAHFHAMLAGIADDLGRGVKTHGLAIEQGRREHRGMVACSHPPH